MILRKYRWSRNYESAEEELMSLLASKKLKASRWLGNEFEEYAARKDDNNLHIWCVEGSIIYTINGKEITLQAGDTLDIPANTTYQAKAGFSGVVCYESEPESL